MKRFWDKVDVRGLDDCWPWLAAKNKEGYGRFSLGSKADNSREVECAHRMAWRLDKGSIPDGMCVLHACDNPPCVNPAHLFLGTKTDNMRDMMNKNRRNHKGILNPASRLTEDAVRVARIYCEQGHTIQSMATVFNVSDVTMGKAVNRQTWQHVV